MTLKSYHVVGLTDGDTPMYTSILALEALDILVANNVSYGELDLILEEAGEYQVTTPRSNLYTIDVNQAYISHECAETVTLRDEIILEYVGASPTGLSIYYVDPTDAVLDSYIEDGSVVQYNNPHQEAGE